MSNTSIYFTHCRIYFPLHWFRSFSAYWGFRWGYSFGGVFHPTDTAQSFYASNCFLMLRTGRPGAYTICYHPPGKSHSHQTRSSFRRDAFCRSDRSDGRLAHRRLAGLSTFAISSPFGQILPFMGVVVFSYFGCFAVRHAAGRYHGIVQYAQWTQ